MKNSPVKEIHYGAEVWTNKDMDDLRKTECLCSNCGCMDECMAAKQFYAVCKAYDMALAVTRCPDWEDRL